MGDLICIEAHDRDWVRFFRDPCRKPLLEIDSDPRHYIAFEEDID